MPDLDFKGKPFVYAHHLSVPFRELVIDPKKSLPGPNGPSLDDNLIIHGDNLEALKALLPRYAGKVDVIYIDPPYNTGNEGWAYNDNVNAPAMRHWLGKVVDRDDLERHDKWLCMMWPRLQLLSELLAEDGTIFVSIDDNEVNSLGLILDEVFGQSGLVAQFVWKSRKFPDSRALTGISLDHEYILAYQKSGDRGFRGVERDETKFANPDNDPRGAWMSRSMLGLATSQQRPNLHYSISDPSTGKEYPAPENRGWRYARERMKLMIADGRVLFPKKDDGRPREKKFLADLQTAKVAFPSIIDDVFTSDGTEELRQIFGTQVFDFPKPSKLVSKLIAQVSSENSIVLDSFAGSGTTAHSVLAANKSDGGERRFILVEREDYADELTAERVRRVARGDAGVRDGLGGTFTFCDLGEPLDLERFFSGEASPAWDQVARYVVYTATGATLSKLPKKPPEDWFVGEAGGYRIHLLYKPDLAFMRGSDAAVSAQLADRIAKANTLRKPVLLYAAARFVSQKELSKQGITFCQLPYAIHRLLGDGPTGSIGNAP